MLSSHAEAGLTDHDFQLAARIQELDSPRSAPELPCGKSEDVDRQPTVVMVIFD